ncbi:MAG: formate/nitrite transporter family protein [Hominisplanchenecus sp.]
MMTPDDETDGKLERSILEKCGSGESLRSSDGAFAKAIFCNICVCLAVWCSIKMKTETGKIMMAILGVMTFVTSGYEHSVANMTFFTIGLLDPVQLSRSGECLSQSSDRHEKPSS